LFFGFDLKKKKRKRKETLHGLTQKGKKEEYKRRNPKIIIIINIYIINNKRFLRAALLPPLFLIRLQFSRSVRYHSDPGQFLYLSLLWEKTQDPKNWHTGNFLQKQIISFYRREAQYLDLWPLSSPVSHISEYELMHFRVYFCILPRADHYKRYYQ